MSWSRFIFKTHKWLAVAVGILTLLWFVSGIVMVSPGRWGRPPGIGQTAGPGPGFREVNLTVAQAIAAVDAKVGRNVQVTEIGFSRIAGKLLYRVHTEGAGTHLVDAVNGEMVVIDAEAAQALLGEFLPKDAPREITLLTSYNREYGIGPLPVYRIALADGNDTTYYVSTTTGEINGTNRITRWRGFFGGLHTFRFLDFVFDSNGVRLTLILFSLVGTVMSLTGLAILYIQYINWRARRRGAAG